MTIHQARVMKCVLEPVSPSHAGHFSTCCLLFESSLHNNLLRISSNMLIVRHLPMPDLCNSSDRGTTFPEDIRWKRMPGVDIGNGEAAIPLKTLSATATL